MIADQKQVQELCTNVFKYSHKLFLEQLEPWKRNISLGKRVAELENKVEQIMPTTS